MAPHRTPDSAMIDCLLDGGTPEQALAHAGQLHAKRGDTAPGNRYVRAVLSKIAWAARTASQFKRLALKHC